MRRHTAVAILAAPTLTIFLVPAAQQRPDVDFDVSVASPAYTSTHPRVVVDEAHHNCHTADGRYRPFATLMHGVPQTITMQE